MTVLPDMLRRLPVVCYGCAAGAFVGSLGHAWLSLSDLGRHADPTLEGVVTFQKSVALLQASLEASYLVGTAAMLQVLIAIFDKLKEPEA